MAAANDFCPLYEFIEKVKRDDAAAAGGPVHTNLTGLVTVLEASANGTFADNKASGADFNNINNILSDYDTLNKTSPGDTNTYVTGLITELQSYFDAGKGGLNGALGTVALSATGGSRKRALRKGGRSLRKNTRKSRKSVRKSRRSVRKNNRKVRKSVRKSVRKNNRKVRKSKKSRK